MQFWTLCWVASVALAVTLAHPHEPGHHDAGHKDAHHKDHHDKHHKDGDHPTVGHHKVDHHDDHHDGHHHKWEGKHKDHQSDIREIEEALAKVAHRFSDLESKLDARKDPERLKKRGSLEHRIQGIEGGNGCRRKDYFQCGGNDPQCVNNLLVCDHHKDCRNGADEAHCDSPIKDGDHFVGDVVFDHCTKRHPKQMTLNIISVKTETYFAGFPKVYASIGIDYDHGGYQGHVTLWSRGFFSFARSRIVLAPPEEDKLGFVAQFDGSDFDTFVGTVRNMATTEACAKFIFHRQTDDNGDD